MSGPGGSDVSYGCGFPHTSHLTHLPLGKTRPMRIGNTRLEKGKRGKVGNGRRRAASRLWSRCSSHILPEAHFLHGQRLEAIVVDVPPSHSSRADAVSKVTALGVEAPTAPPSRPVAVWSQRTLWPLLVLASWSHSLVPHVRSCLKRYTCDLSHQHAAACTRTLCAPCGCNCCK